MSTLFQVVFVGGPLHGTRTLMAAPEFKMAMEAANGECFEYCRRMVETADKGEILQIATYAPTGLPEHEFERLAAEVQSSDRRAVASSMNRRRCPEPLQTLSRGSSFMGVS